MVELMTLKETREKLRVSTTMIYKLMEEGKIAYYQVGNKRKIHPEDLDAYIRSTRVPAKYEKAAAAAI